MIDYSEKRDFIRMPVNRPVQVREPASGREETAELLDLSASGVRLRFGRALEAGARLELRIQPDRPITPPLEATLSVLRCDVIDDGYDIAATIEQVQPAIYAEEAG
jgi:hypothetical protein